VPASEVDSYRRFIFGTIDRIVGALDGLEAGQLDWRPPAPETNSLVGIATHVLGNAEENVLGTLCGRRPACRRALGRGAADPEPAAASRKDDPP